MQSGLQSQLASAFTNVFDLIYALNVCCGKVKRSDLAKYLFGN